MVTSHGLLFIEGAQTDEVIRYNTKHEGQLVAIGKQLLSTGGHTEQSLSTLITHKVNLLQPPTNA